jgi:hypothetical protein
MTTNGLPSVILLLFSNGPTTSLAKLTGFSLTFLRIFFVVFTDEWLSFSTLFVLDGTAVFDAALLALPDSVTQPINGFDSSTIAFVALTLLPGLLTPWTALHMFFLVVNGSHLVVHSDTSPVP